MKVLTLLFLSLTSVGAQANPITFPIFLKAGFSSVLEFEEAATKVVLGDSNSFQVERMENSLVIKTLVPYAVTNMFVYFKSKPSRLFVLTANEDSEPTYYQKFESLTAPKPPLKPSSPPRYTKGIALGKATFDAKKDYLTIEAKITTDSASAIHPDWDLVRLLHGTGSTRPMKLWAERKEVQKDSSVKARFIFAKPNVPRNLAGVVLVLPVKGDPSALRLGLGGSR